MNKVVSAISALLFILGSLTTPAVGYLQDNPFVTNNMFDSANLDIEIVGDQNSVEVTNTGSIPVQFVIDVETNVECENIEVEADINNGEYTVGPIAIKDFEHVYANAVVIESSQSKDIDFEFSASLTCDLTVTATAWQQTISEPTGGFWDTEDEILSADI